MPRAYAGRSGGAPCRPATTPADGLSEDEVEALPEGESPVGGFSRRRCCTLLDELINPLTPIRFAARRCPPAVGSMPRRPRRHNAGIGNAPYLTPILYRRGPAAVLA
jgi:hypothetical protein